jgi:hypothetical protein
MNIISSFSPAFNGQRREERKNVIVSECTTVLPWEPANQPTTSRRPLTHDPAANACTRRGFYKHTFAGAKLARSELDFSAHNRKFNQGERILRNALYPIGLAPHPHPQTAVRIANLFSCLLMQKPISLSLFLSSSSATWGGAGNNYAAEVREARPTCHAVKSADFSSFLFTQEISTMFARKIRTGLADARKQTFDNRTLWW